MQWSQLLVSDAVCSCVCSESSQSCVVDGLIGRAGGRFCHLFFLKNHVSRIGNLNVQYLPCIRSMSALEFLSELQK